MSDDKSKAVTDILAPSSDQKGPTPAPPAVPEAPERIEE